MKNWMSKLASYYEKMRKRYHDDRLLILFDIDGTIIDMRFMIHYVLKSYDQHHGTSFFKNLKVNGIDVHENQLDQFLKQLDISPLNKEIIFNWYLKQRWTSLAIYESHRPFLGVMEVIRWFQMQPNTYVGLNTGRHESLRDDTFFSLNKLGEQYKVRFNDDLLYMNIHEWEKNIPENKAAGVFHFQRIGYRIFAFIDNEPENLEIISNHDYQNEILLLHPDTIFQSQRQKLPSNAISGKNYDITELIKEKTLPRHVQFVWHGVNDETNLHDFLSSSIDWAECDIRLDPARKELILRHNSFEENPLQEYEQLYSLKQLLGFIKKFDKFIKLDLKENGKTLDKVLQLVKDFSFKESQLWFNAKIDDIQEQGFWKVSSIYPFAILQCPIDEFAPLILNAPNKAKEILIHLKSWGINRFSLNWKTQKMRQILNQLERWQFEVNIYNVPDLKSFLKAVLLLPKSVTSDFNFPKWSYYGGGSGQNWRHHKYSSHQSRKKEFA